MRVGCFLLALLAAAVATASAEHGSCRSKGEGQFVCMKFHTKVACEDRSGFHPVCHWVGEADASSLQAFATSFYSFGNSSASNSTDGSTCGPAKGAAQEKKVGVGLAAAATSVLFFGSNFLPIKQHDTGDGMFFQWVMACGIFLVGLCVNLEQSNPQFQPFAMLGGITWCTGNLLTVPIVHRIGLAKGLLIWGGAGLVSGWAGGVSGLFGLICNQRDTVNNWGLNIGGVLVALVALGLSSQVKTTVNRAASQATSLNKNLLDEESDAGLEEAGMATLEQPVSSREVVEGYLMACLAGICYGLNFDPPQHIMDFTEGASQEGLDYVFSHFTGIYVAATVYFVVYCVIKVYRDKQDPQVYPRVIVPAIISGSMWAVAQTAWFVANDNLGMVLTFPLISVAPAAVASLYGVFLFGEIKGTRNYVALLSVFLALTVGTLMIVASKK